MKQISANVTVKIDGTPFQISVSVPNKKTKQEVLLPLFRELTQKAETLATTKLAETGTKISCTKGCGACCCQLVPVTPLEARYLIKLMESMPKAKRQKYKTRFEEAYKQLQQAQILEELLHPENIDDDIIEIGLKYFHLNIPCPFLEDSSCSIYTERPLRCREYLVTNAASHCSNPANETIQRVDYPVQMSRLLARISQPWTTCKSTWVPLSLIPEWAKLHTEESILRHSKEWVDEALIALSSQKP